MNLSPVAVAPAESSPPPEFMKAPFCYFGGKTSIAPQVWAAFGSVRNYVEPFAGSLGVLLNRPSPRLGPETVNDLDCCLVNVWRAISEAPEELARMLVAPVAEVETEAQHAALIRDTPEIRRNLADNDWYDTRRAAWWIKGANEWVGSGWCSGEGPWNWTQEGGWEKLKRNRQLPHLGNAGTGVNRKLPHLGNAGTGVNRQLPHLGDAGKGNYERRVEWVSEWLCALRDRICQVRIACGDWKRVLGDCITTKHGMTGVFLDPPYAGTEYVYGGKVDVSAEVREWCITKSTDPKLRIVLAGRGEEHDALLAHGWTRFGWSARRGYSNTELRATETLWLSPNCLPI